MSSVCKYCGRVELIWDDAHKSKSGKHIPLEKASGLPHQCSDNPYTKQQQQEQQESKPQPKMSGNPTEQDNNPLAPVSDESVDRGISAFSMVTNLIRLVEQTQKLLVSMDGKIDRLLNLTFAQEQKK